MFTPASLDRFVMTQDEVLRACLNQLNADETRNSIREQLINAMGKIVRWANENRVAYVSLTPRTRDIFVAVVAPDEDLGGVLHDSMCDVDLEIMHTSNIRMEWMLFRASERSGVDAFIDQSAAWVLIGEQHS